ncbi:MAG: NAD(P)H-dependent oxidoreductase [Geminicoccaceae bacterium]
MARILAFSGSTRTGSINGRLLSAVIPVVEAKGAKVTPIDLRDFEMPLYNGDLEADEGLPEATLRLKALMKEHDGMLIASPEYNGSFTPLLKNTLDWCSRRDESDDGPLAVYRNRTAAIVAASGGKFGGMRSLTHLRQLLTNLGLLVIPQQVAVGGFNDAIGEDGSIRDEGIARMIDGLAERWFGSIAPDAAVQGRRATIRRASAVTRWSAPVGSCEYLSSAPNRSRKRCS